MKQKEPIVKQSLHPSDRALADFIDNRLPPKEREETIEHLIYCDECCDIVVSVIKYIKKSIK